MASKSIAPSISITISPSRAERGGSSSPSGAQLREVAQERTAVARPEPQLAAGVLEHAAEAVPLRLVRPALARAAARGRAGPPSAETGRVASSSAGRSGASAMPAKTTTLFASCAASSITGFGAVTPLGLDAPSTWEAAVAGRSGIGFIESFDASDYPVRIAGEVRGFDPVRARARQGGAPDGPQCPPRRRRRAGGLGPRGDRGVRPGARRDPRRLRDRRDRHDRRAAADAASSGAADRVSPFFIPSALVDTASGQIAIQLGITGPNYAPVSACATGSTAIGEGAATIVRGQADVVLAGGTEARIIALILAGFCAMRGLVAEDVDPTLAMRPFDATRAGFVMGEGACILVLEELEAAQARGARDLRRGARLRRLERRTPPGPARARGNGRGGDDRARRSTRRASRPSGSATSTRTAPRRRSAISPRRGRSTGLRQARVRPRGLVDEVGHRVIASAPPARSRR